MGPLGENVQGAMHATATADPAVQAAAVGAAVTASLPSPPLPADVGFLWKALVVGLLAVLLVAAGGIIYTVADGNTSTTPDVLVTIFTSVLTGLVGLFVQSPRSN